MKIGQIIIQPGSSIPDGGNNYIVENGKTIRFNTGICQLGIQYVPGYQFNLNNSNWDISLGKTGIYELDLNNIGLIKTISLEMDSGNLLPYPQNTLIYGDIFNNTDTTPLIIDYVMEEG